MVCQRRSVLPDLKIDHQPKVVAEPHPLDWLIECELRRRDAGVSLRVRVPAADEHIVEALVVVRLAHDRLCHGLGVRVFAGPGVAGSLAGDRPGVVVSDAAAGQGLQAGKVADAGGAGPCVEVSGDDGRQRAALAGVQLRDGDGLALAGGFGAEPPGGGGADEQQIAFAGDIDRDRQRRPRKVAGLGQAQIKAFDEPMRPAGRHGAAAVLVGERGDPRLHVRLMRRLEVHALQQAPDAGGIRRLDDLLEGDQIRVEAAKFLVDQIQATLLALGVPDIEGHNADFHEISPKR